MKISLNLPDEVYEQLQSLAKENERTLTGEVVYALKRHLIYVFLEKEKDLQLNNRYQNSGNYEGF